MKTSRLILVGLAMAVIAAVVTIFAQSLLEGEGTPLRSGPTELVVAARPLAAGQRLKADDLATAPSPGPSTARTAFASSTSVIGRTLIVPLEQGQVVREEDLADRGSGAAIASQLAPGLRAITITLRDAGPEVVLYPGALVDVLATVETPARGGARESVTRTLVEGVRVVAVNDEAVGGRPADAGDRRTSPRRPTVTVAVTPEQAAQVELASSRGTIGVTLRSSDEPAGQPGSNAIATTQSLLGLSPEPAAVAKPAPTAEAPKETAERPAVTPAIPVAAPATPAAPEKPRSWEVKVFRGKDSTSHSFPEKPGSGTPNR
jgi:pilus assembly protein CpaB